MLARGRGQEPLMGDCPLPHAGYGPGRIHAISEKSKKTSKCIFGHFQKQKELISIHHYESELYIVKFKFANTRSE